MDTHVADECMLDNCVKCELDTLTKNFRDVFDGCRMNDKSSITIMTCYGDGTYVERLRKYKLDAVETESFKRRVDYILMLVRPIFDKEYGFVK